MCQVPDVEFHWMLVEAANKKIGEDYIDEGDNEIQVGHSLPDDGNIPDAVDADGGLWRIKVTRVPKGFAVTRHRMVT